MEKVFGTFSRLLFFNIEYCNNGEGVTQNNFMEIVMVLYSTVKLISAFTPPKWIKCNKCIVVYCHNSEFLQSQKS